MASANAASESGIVQQPLINYAVEAGWTSVPPRDALALRHGETGRILHDVFVEKVQELNPDVVDSEAAGGLASRLIRIRPNVEGNLDAWEYLAGLKIILVAHEKRERNIRLLDTDDVAANTFHVTEEWRYTSGAHTIRPDVVFLINGIPVLIVEAKAATIRGGIGKALDQLRRYSREGPELMAILQLFVVTQLVHFYYGATWSYSSKTLFNWKDEAAGDFEGLVKSFIEPRRIVKAITDYILFTRTDEELRKVVLRPHQMRAVERVVDRAASSEKRRGLVWHTQGSGKTYSMITAAKLIIEGERFENPTVLMLVDRNELEAQLFGNLEALGFSRVAVAGSKKQLQDLLSSDTRGLIVSMIHKFDDMPAEINAKENLFVLVDEAHRTTGGDLGNYLMAALPNATYIGFTGTPIDRSSHGKGTFKVFGSDDPETRYLDKYSIAESIADGTTVQLHYALAPNDLRVDRDVLEEEFLSLAEAEGVSDVEEMNRVLDRAVNLKNMLKNQKRIERVAKFAADHFTENVEPMGFKAFLVAVDREACVRYKEALDKHLPAEQSTVVMSHGHYDDEALARHHLSDEQEKQVRKDFRNPAKSPKILIVTEKLLTGFDAPILYAMYLDKPMRDHVLLQAIARVNRPFEDEEGLRKPAGFVLDFIGIFENLEKALAFDSSDIAGVVADIDILKTHFVAMMEEGQEFLEIGSGLKGDKHVEAIIERFRDPEAMASYYKWFREMQEVYDILSPDPFLRPHLKDFSRLANIYDILRSTETVDISGELSRKTAALVQEHTRSGVIQAPEEIYELGEDALQRIAESDRPDTVKIFNLLKLIENAIRERGNEAPYLSPIGERAEAIIKRYQERQISTQEALEQLRLDLGDIEALEQQRKDSGLTPEGLTGLLLLQEDGVENVVEIAKEMTEAFASLPHWRTSEEQERELRKALYKAVLKTGTAHTEVVDRLLDVLRRGSS
jgi:type I restriction enzyme R subunit